MLSEFSIEHAMEVLLAILKEYAQYEASDFQPRLAVSLESQLGQV